MATCVCERERARERYYLKADGDRERGQHLTIREGSEARHMALPNMPTLP